MHLPQFVRIRGLYQITREIHRSSMACNICRRASQGGGFPLFFKGWKPFKFTFTSCHQSLPKTRWQGPIRLHVQRLFTEPQITNSSEGFTICSTYKPTPSRDSGWEKQWKIIQHKYPDKGNLAFFYIPLLKSPILLNLLLDQKHRGENYGNVAGNQH